MTSVVWKYASRLDDASPHQTATNIAKMLDFWNHGPHSFVTKYSNLESPPPSTVQTATVNSPHTSLPPTVSNGKTNPMLYRSPIAANYVIFCCADGQKYLVSHSVARMCDSLVEILDELDLQNADEEFEDENKRALLAAASTANSAAGGGGDAGASPVTAGIEEPPAAITQQIEAITEDCALLEVAITSLALEAVVVYLSLAIEHGATSTIPYPLTGVVSSKSGSIEALIQPWESNFLKDYTPHQVSLPSQSNSPAGTSKVQAPFVPYSSASSNAAALLQVNTTTTTGNASGNNTPTIFCPPLISVLRAADYLGINSLRDLTCASLAMKVLSVRDENVLANMLGLPKLPSEAELEDVYARFPFLIPTRFASSSSNSNNTAASAHHGGGATAAATSTHHAPTSP